LVLDGDDKLHTPATLLPGKKLLVPIDWRLGELQSQYGPGGVEKIPASVRN